MKHTLILNKRGTEGLTIENIIGLVLSIIAVLALTYIALKLLGVLHAEDEELTASRNSFSEMTRIVERLTKEDSDFSYQTVPLFFAEDASIIGFDRDSDSVIDRNDVYIYKPTKCYEKACICLYYDREFQEDDGLKKRDYGVVDCVSYPSNLKLSSLYQPVDAYASIGKKREQIEPNGFTYAYPVFYGAKPLGLQNVYIESYKNEYVFMDIMSTEVRTRMETVKQKNTAEYKEEVDDLFTKVYECFSQECDEKIQVQYNTITKADFWDWLEENNKDFDNQRWIFVWEIDNTDDVYSIYYYIYTKHTGDQKKVILGDAGVHAEYTEIKQILHEVKQCLTSECYYTCLTTEHERISASQILDWFKTVKEDNEELIMWGVSALLKDSYYLLKTEKDEECHPDFEGTCVYLQQTSEPARNSCI